MARTVIGPGLPAVTGPRANNHEQASTLLRQAQADLDSVHATKREAALTPLTRDQGRENLEKVKRAR